MWSLTLIDNSWYSGIQGHHCYWSWNQDPMKHAVFLHRNPWLLESDHHLNREAKHQRSINNCIKKSFFSMGNLFCKPITQGRTTYNRWDGWYNRWVVEKNIHTLSLFFSGAWHELQTNSLDRKEPKQLFLFYLDSSGGGRRIGNLKSWKTLHPLLHLSGSLLPVRLPFQGGKKEASGFCCSQVNEGRKGVQGLMKDLKLVGTFRKPIALLIILRAQS